MSKESLKADFKAKVLDLQDAAIDALIDAAQGEVPQSGSVGFSQEQMDAAVLAKSEADKVILDGVQAELDAAKAQDDADKAALSASQAILDKVRAALG